MNPQAVHITLGILGVVGIYLLALWMSNIVNGLKYYERFPLLDRALLFVLPLAMIALLYFSIVCLVALG